MINALQALVSVLISKKKIEEKGIDEHMEVFMSTAHFLNKARPGVLQGQAADRTAVACSSAW